MSNSNYYRHLKLQAGENRPQTVRVLYAMRNGYLYRSSDGGVNWKLRRDPALAALIAEGTTLAARMRPHHRA
jgi:hypothetical protein